MKRFLSFSLIAIYLMIPGNVFAKTQSGSENIDELVATIAENSS